MPDPTVIAGDVIVRGAISAGALTIPQYTVTDSMVSNTANLAASKLVHHFPVGYSQKGASDVGSETMPLHIAKANGSISAFKVLPTVAPTGGDKKYTVDLQKSTSAGNYASVLSSVVTVDNASVSRTSQTAAISNTSFIAGDTFQVVVTASGSTGSQGQGVLAEAMFQEPVA